jgi:hypothetical protein
MIKNNNNNKENYAKKDKENDKFKNVNFKDEKFFNDLESDENEKSSKIK